MNAKTKRYQLVDFLYHMDQSRAEEMAFHEKRGHFTTEAERIAFRAGHQAGARNANAMIAMHGGFRLSIDA